MSVYGEFDFERWVQGLVLGREELLWTGRPDRRTGFSVWTHIVVPSACLWLYFMLLSLIPFFIFLQDKPDEMQARISLLFLLYFPVIFAFVTVWVMYSVLRASTYYYALTDQRAIVLQRSLGESYTSYSFSSGDVGKLIRANGHIHIVFENAKTRHFLRRFYQSKYFDFFAPAGSGIVFRRLSEADANRVLSHIAAIRRELQLGAGSPGD